MRPYFWLSIPDTSPQYRIMGIDPGTSTLGVSVISVCLQTHVITLEFSKTLNSERMLSPYAAIQEFHGNRFAKLYALQHALTYLMQEWDVQAIVSESPYLGRFPQAFAALTECVCTIRNAILNYNPYMTLYTIDPATIKMNVGVSGKSSDKNLMRNAIIDMCERRQVLVADDINIYELDEHSIDSIAAAIAQMKLLV